MSDPLTALMHAVQVMNLLKTLILKTLREREEAAMGEDDDYTPYSVSPSYDRQNGDDDDDESDDGDESDDDDYNSEHYMEKSGELREPYSDHEVGVTGESAERRFSRDYHAHYSSHVSEDEDGDGSLRDIEECFLRQLEWKGEDKEVDNVNQESTCCGQATQSSCSEYTVSSSLSLSDGNKVSVSSTSCEVDSETSATEDTDTRADVKFPLKNVEVRKAVEIIECKSVMDKDSIPCTT